MTGGFIINKNICRLKIINIKGEKRRNATTLKAPPSLVIFVVVFFFFFILYLRRFLTQVRLDLPQSHLLTRNQLTRFLLLSVESY